MLAGRIHRTPLLSSRTIGERAGVALYLKAESLQKTGSFKPRGVLNRIGQLTAEEKSRGLVAVSAGNHAQALAWGASAAGVASTIVMPADASPAKVAATRAYGGEVVLHGDVWAAFEKMEELRRERGLTLLHPYDDPAVIAGQGTVGLEIVEDLPDVEAVIVPVGGGGLLAGIATAVKSVRPDVRVYGVEPEGAAGLSRAMAEGRVVRLERVATIADGLAAPMTGEHVLAQAREYVDEVVMVPDDDIVRALRLLLERARLFVEPAGAAAVAALVSGRIALPPHARTVAVVSGGNLDLNRLKEMLT